jgi:hypothetical protein
MCLSKLYHTLLKPIDYITVFNTFYFYNPSSTSTTYTVSSTETAAPVILRYRVRLSMTNGQCTGEVTSPEKEVTVINCQCTGANVSISGRTAYNVGCDTASALTASASNLNGCSIQSYQWYSSSDGSSWSQLSGQTSDSYTPNINTMANYYRANMVIANSNCSEIKIASVSMNKCQAITGWVTTGVIFRTWTGVDSSNYKITITVTATGGSSKTLTVTDRTSWGVGDGSYETGQITGGSASTLESLTVNLTIAYSGSGAGKYQVEYFQNCGGGWTTLVPVTSIYSTPITIAPASPCNSLIGVAPSPFPGGVIGVRVTVGMPPP